MTPNKDPMVEKIVEEFEGRSLDAEYRQHKDTFWFEEGEHLRYDQESAAKWLRTTLLRFKEEVEGEERQAWLDGKRCEICGKIKEPDPLTNCCADCFETAK